MNIGSLFSGIGGLELGLERAGLGSTIWQVEQDKFCIKILEKHWPRAKRFTDVREVGKHNLEPVDLICGGFPCQDISPAGKRAGLAGARSGLWYEFARVVDELGPEWVVIENVADGAHLWVDAIRGYLGQSGYESLPVPIAARDVGAPHRRERVFIVAHSTNDRYQRCQPSGLEAQQSAIAGSGEIRASGDPDSDSEPAKPQHGEVARLQGVADDAPPWEAPPDIRGVDDGVPRRMDRLRALGNAVVPQCAEVVGHVISLLRGDE
jgi:DNA (cytosine-5)-methyltransferase 1